MKSDFKCWPCKFEWFVLVFWTGCLYYPSLFQIARSDQLAYLMETAGIKDWSALAWDLYDFNRQRVFAKGDELLFRPFFYFILGTERWLFGYHFMLWQLAGVVLHTVVLIWLLRLLRLFGLNRGGLLLVLFFSSLPLCMNMVIWNHLHGYLVFVWMLLIALFELYCVTEKGRLDLRSFILLLTSLSLATFSYDTGCIFTVLFAVYLGTRRGVVCPFGSRVRAAMLLSIPSFAYVALSVLDFFFRKSNAPEANIITSEFHLFSTLKSMVIMGFWWFYSGIESARLVFFARPGGQFRISPTTPLFPPWNSWDSLSIFVTLMFVGLVVSYFLIFRKTISMAYLKRQIPMLSLILGMLLIYTLVIAVGRINARGLENNLKYNNYYSYPFWIFTVVFIGLSIHAKRLRQVSPALRKIAILILLGGTLFNGVVLWKINAGVASQDAPSIQLVQTVDAFLSEHSGGEVSFEIAPSIPGNPNIFPNVSGPEFGDYTLLAVLYPHHVKKEGGKFYFDGREWTEKRRESPSQ